jgi:hypothetical protein
VALEKKNAIALRNGLLDGGLDDLALHLCLRRTSIALRGADRQPGRVRNPGAAANFSRLRQKPARELPIF